MSRRPFDRPVPRTTWYMHNPRYRAYMLRELTCVIVIIYCVLLLAGIGALASDQPAAWQSFLKNQQHPIWLVFHALALVFFTVYQTMAWFRLAPKAMPLHLGKSRVPDTLIVAAHYAAWIVLSVIVV